MNRLALRTFAIVSLAVCSAQAQTFTHHAWRGSTARSTLVEQNEAGGPLVLSLASIPLTDVQPAAEKAAPAGKQHSASKATATKAEAKKPPTKKPAAKKHKKKHHKKS